MALANADSRWRRAGAGDPDDVGIVVDRVLAVLVGVRLLIFGT